MPDEQTGMVKLDAQTYSVTEVPGAETLLVQSLRKEVLKGMPLDKVTDGLARTGELLQLAFCGTAGTGRLVGKDFLDVQPDVSALTFGVAELCDESEATMVAFSEGCRAVINLVVPSFRFLLAGNEKGALLCLGRACDAAADMAKAAEKLSAAFNKKANEAKAVLAKTMKTKNYSERQREDAENQIKKLEEDKKAAEKLIRDIEESKKELQKLYEEAREAEKDLSNKAFAGEIIGAIFGGLAQAVGTFGAVYADLKTGGSFPKPKTKPDRAPKPPGEGEGADKPQKDPDGKTEEEEETKPPEDPDGETKEGDDEPPEKGKGKGK